MFRKTYRALLALTLALSLCAGSAAAATYKIATNVNDEGLVAIMLNEFVENVSAKTDGRVKFKIFSNSVLGDQMQYFQQIQKGIIDAGLMNTAAIENVIPVIGVLNLPFIFRNSDEYRAVLTNKEVSDIIFATAPSHNFAPLGFISSTWRSIYTVKPVATPEDIKGMKLRTMSSESYIEMLAAFGAVPTPLPLSELYSGMQMGVVDGSEGGLSGLYDMKLGEVAKYALRTEQARLSDMVVVSPKFLGKLKPEDAKIVQEEFLKISAKSVTIADEHDQRMIAKCIDELGVTVHEVDKAPLIKAVEPMYRKAMDDPAKAALIKKIFELTGRTM